MPVVPPACNYKSGSMDVLPDGRVTVTETTEEKFENVQFVKSTENPNLGIQFTNSTVN